MSKQYQRQIDMATRMIAKYGQAVTWNKQAESIDDPAKPWKTKGTDPVPFSATILFLRPSGGLARALLHLIKGTDVPAGSVRGLMNFDPRFTPEITDNVTRNGSTLVVSSINSVSPNGEVIMYDIEFS
jgi:hypothetical protein